MDYEVIENKLKNFKKAAKELRDEWSKHDLIELNLSTKYPFKEDFDAICSDIDKWVGYYVGKTTECSVTFIVWSDVKVEIKKGPNESDESLIERAKEKAMKEHSKVPWMFEEDQEPKIIKEEP